MLQTDDPAAVTAARGGLPRGSGGGGPTAVAAAPLARQLSGQTAICPDSYLARKLSSQASVWSDGCMARKLYAQITVWPASYLAR